MNIYNSVLVYTITFYKKFVFNNINIILIFNKHNNYS